jgi:hypothetical protein
MALLAAGADKSSRMDAMAADEGETPWRRGRFNTGARRGTYSGANRRLTTMSDQRRRVRRRQARRGSQAVGAAAVSAPLRRAEEERFVRQG